MDTKKLRQKILDLAIRGKLVPQDPNDEPASVLLERIRAEKERLIKEGKIKRSKKSASDDEIEAPFEIPESWEWCNITEITNKITDGTHNSPPNGPTGAYKYVTAKNIKPSGIILDNISYVDEAIHNEIYSRCNPEYGDILYIKDGATTGVVTINNLNEPFSLLSSVALIKTFSGISNNFLLYYLQSDICLKSVRRSMKGVGITRITLKQIEQWNIPLPPYPEQKRIASAVERWFTLIDELESNEGDLLKTIDKAKFKILDLAIHGKLVPQDPNDEPASVLLQKIREGKQQLVKAGKLKKKDLIETPISEDEIPFEIPDTWEWCRLGTIVSLIGGFAFKSHEYTSTGSRVIRISDITENGFINKNVVRYPFNDKLSQYRIFEGDILMAMTGGTVGKSLYVKDLPEEIMLLNQRVAIIRVNTVFTDYIDYVIKSQHIQSIITEAKNSTNDNISMGDIFNFPIPLPPLSEQKRIVAKIEEVFAEIDKLK